MRYDIATWVHKTTDGPSDMRIKRRFKDKQQYFELYSETHCQTLQCFQQGIMYELQLTPTIQVAILPVVDYLLFLPMEAPCRVCYNI